ncbi:class I SAM-dependent methyltransferase [Halorussus halophilus]|uniref:FkbM family methyltransferase n=1 Tax=Halorussus halophilus TaxID=2650975 RepID=UPI001301840F|nr:FkbM family methyltransferase [Halorussus halophilus]
MPDDSNNSEQSNDSKPRTQVFNGVAVPTVEPEEGIDYFPEYEDGTSSALRRRVRPGDDVVVVGGGRGITTVSAARATGPEGSVTTYEANAEMLQTLQRTILANRVTDRVTLEHAAVGPVQEGSKETFGPPDGDRRDPSAIPDCDVLELDCEGSEVEVLQNLEARPRVVVVETHEPIGVPSADSEAALEAMGYRIENCVDAGANDELEVLTAVRAE